MIHHLLDYETLRLIWWALLGILLIGFAVMDGFDMGVAILLPFTTKTDTERRIAINSIAPVWEGNQVWFILGAGSVFAAWPLRLCNGLLRFIWGSIFRPCSPHFKTCRP